MDFDSDRPIYIQIVDDFKYKIACGTVGVGKKLPSTTELTKTYGITQNTALQVYEKLRVQGLCVVKRGIGTFVINDNELREKLKEELKNSLVETYKSRMSQLGFDTNEMVKAISFGEKGSV